MLSLSTARSSLEEMLETLRRDDENQTPRDFPPALPPRPKAVSRARLPSAKRRLPITSEAGEMGPALNCRVERGETEEKSENCFGGKRVEEMEEVDSPYVAAARNLKLEEKDNGKLGHVAPGSVSRFRESTADDDVGRSMKKKLRVWCRLHDGFWESGQIKSTSGEKNSVLLSDGNVVTVPTQDLLPANPQILDGVDDLVQLSYLNEPSVLHNLQYRYSQDNIYSKAGPVLLAINPFKDVQLYGDGIVAAYRKKLSGSPHVYTIADAAYNAMITDDINQSIIVSGESGAGKTETAKLAMQYLAALGGCGGIESKIMQSSCILEAFGNAKTARNNNSSRFGKLIEIHFNAAGQICGAKIQTSPLEKSRVVQLVQGERSYNIFYQLCSGAPSGLRGKLRLKPASEYNYLKQSDCLEIQNIDDAQKFHNVMGALDSIGVSKEDQEHVFAMLAAVLWLGNISFVVTDNHKHIEVVADEAVTNVACLIGCREQDLVHFLSTRKVRAGKDEVSKSLTLDQAVDARDALARFIYSSLFEWLVEEINLSLSMGKDDLGRSISILDIYGFESFKKNSFEQFCINYANERLQQHCLRHLIKLEQEEYELDGVDMKTVNFEDNKDCLDLFEKKPTGLISLLDEVSNLPKSTDLTFATKLQHMNTNRCFRVERGGSFSVRHYAGEVLYETAKFLERNRDPVHSGIIELLASCTCRLPQSFAALHKQSQDLDSTFVGSGMLNSKNQSVATKFKGQLFRLIQHLESTKPHFIHCIRPNNKQIPNAFEKDIVLEQLRSYEILQIIRISRSGYPARMTHQEFTDRYRFLLGENMDCQDPLDMSIAILQKMGILPEMYRVGFTKLYFRKREIEALEDVRKQVLQDGADVQKYLYGRHPFQDFGKLKEVAVTFQSYVRGEIARKKHSVGLKKQVVRGKPDEQFTAVVQIQSVIRGWMARKQFSLLRNSRPSNASNQKPGRKMIHYLSEQEVEPEMVPSVVAELRKRVIMAEATLRQKETENEALKEQVMQYEARWSEYEAKMQSMEQMWQKQITSLQMSLTAARKNLSADNAVNPARRVDGAQSPQFYESEDTSMGTQTPGGSTPVRYGYNGIDELSSRDTNGTLNPVNHLTKEFEERKRAFDEEAQAILEVKSDQSAIHLVEEFRRLKHRFEAWKKDYKTRLKEAKVKVYKLGRAEAEKQRRKWWGKRSKR